MAVRKRWSDFVVSQLENRIFMWGNTGMTNIGQVDLPTSPVLVPAQYSAAIDPTTNFGYFGSAHGANPGIISKINLNGPVPTVVQDGLPNTIPSGVASFSAVEIDTSNADPTKHYLYVAGGGYIVKLSPGDSTHDPQFVNSIPMVSAVGGVLCGAIDSNYVYFGVTESSDVKVLRIRLSDFTDQGAETIQMPNIRTCAIDTTHHYLYFTTYGSVPEICKVNLATFTPGGTSTATYNMSSNVPGDGIGVAGYDLPQFDIGLVVDPIHQFAYMGSLGASSDPVINNTYPYNQSIVVRVNLGNGDTFPAHPISVLTLGVGERDLTTAQIDLANGNVYFGTDLTFPGHVYMIHVGDGTVPMTEVGRLDGNVGTDPSYPPDGTGSIVGNTPEYGGEIFFRSSILDVAQNAIYIGTDARPGQIIKIGINGPVPLNLAGPNIYLKLDADGKNLDVFNNSTGTGSFQQTLVSQISSLSVTGTSGDDSLTVDFSDGNPLPTGGLSFNGGGNATSAGDVLRIIGNNSNTAVTTSANQFLFGTTPIQFTNTEQITFDPNGGVDSVNASGGSLTLAPSLPHTNLLAWSFSNLNISSGAQLLLIAPSTHAGRILLSTQSISISPTGQLDLSGNDAIVRSGDTNTLSSRLGSGENNGHWNGQGIYSSAAGSDTTFLTALGMFPVINAGSFDTQSVSPGDVLIKYTYVGDANLDGKVDGSDYSRIDNGFLKGLTGWFNGDFNYDNSVNGSDYTLIDNAFNSQAASLAGKVTAPPAAKVAAIPAMSFASFPLEFSSAPVASIADLILDSQRLRSSRGSPELLEALDETQPASRSLR